MKNRILWLVVIAATVAGFYYVMVKPAITPPAPPKPSPLAGLRPAPMPPPELPPPVITTPFVAKPPPLVMATSRSSTQTLEVPIQNGATIDFSTGAPNVRSGGDDKAALDRALREMAEATRNVTFPPSTKK